jgi:hypothetical protein
VTPFEQMPDFLSLLLWGFAATLVLTIILCGSQRAGLSRLSLPFLLGTCLTADRDWDPGSGLHGLSDRRLDLRRYLCRILRVAGHHMVDRRRHRFRPRSLSAARDPAHHAPHPSANGLLGLNYGYRTPLTTLIAQVAYGVVLGAFLPG